MDSTSSTLRTNPPPSHAQRFAAWAVRAFHAYANWLVGISWKRFIVLSILLMIISGVLQNLPPFTWRISETVETVPPRPPKPPKPAVAFDKPVHYDVTIDQGGIRIRPAGEKAAGGAASAAAAAASVSAAAADAASAAASAASEALARHRDMPSISIDLPADVKSSDVRAAVEEARQAIEEAVADAREAADDAARAKQDLQDEARIRVHHVELGEPLPPMAFAFIIASMILKISYKGRLQAEVKAAQATETAEAESLKRQVVEARMAAMQAQVEPHFLFNTLASIDHLIETDPARASKMQKNLIALLRASMPTLREADTNLGRELAVIRPYLEILKVRMEERLQTEIRVSDGLLSAEFPPMMLQSLVENAIKHGLEPKAEGGTLAVAAEIVHGDLVVSVADTGLGFGKAATAGTGLGLSNIRERLHLLYGERARVEVAENPGGGTRVSITVPYRSKARTNEATA
ncbi:MAG TPA: sensor histidine kinase [Burkholderiaceae bacterium]|nr:sensor histidine kinase [Burkholderiaceae bacterium]